VGWQLRLVSAKRNSKMVEYRVRSIRDMVVGTLDAGVRGLIKEMEKKKVFSLVKLQKVNRNRYAFMIGMSCTYLVIYKREVFKNFGTQFRDQGFRGVGDTINTETIKQAIRMGVKRFFTIYPTGAVYTMRISDFINKSVKWENKEGKEVRSVSVHEYERIYTIKHDKVVRDDTMGETQKTLEI
jgi:hypothetical protein